MAYNDTFTNRPVTERDFNRALEYYNKKPHRWAPDDTIHRDAWDAVTMGVTEWHPAAVPNAQSKGPITEKKKWYETDKEPFNLATAELPVSEIVAKMAKGIETGLNKYNKNRLKRKEQRLEDRQEKIKKKLKETKEDKKKAENVKVKDRSAKIEEILDKVASFNLNPGDKKGERALGINPELLEKIKKFGQGVKGAIETAGDNIKAGYQDARDDGRLGELIEGATTPGVKAPDATMELPRNSSMYAKYAQNLSEGEPTLPPVQQPSMSDLLGQMAQQMPAQEALMRYTRGGFRTNGENPSYRGMV